MARYSSVTNGLTSELHGPRTIYTTATFFLLRLSDVQFRSLFSNFRDTTDGEKRK